MVLDGGGGGWQEGVVAFWRGNTAAVVRVVPYMVRATAVREWGARVRTRSGAANAPPGRRSDPDTAS